MKNFIIWILSVVISVITGTAWMLLAIVSLADEQPEWVKKVLKLD